MIKLSSGDWINPQAVAAIVVDVDIVVFKGHNGNEHLSIQCKDLADATMCAQESAELINKALFPLGNAQCIPTTFPVGSAPTNFPIANYGTPVQPIVIPASTPLPGSTTWCGKSKSTTDQSQ